MDDKTIDELDAKEELKTTDVFPVVDTVTNETEKVSIAQLDSRYIAYSIALG